ncbi:hypothetical protein [Leptobacterium sp. I13]|uniref:hypothetical protein n=1 Tax=Leptobacterium meishanense TaxID=3128904 RepID=UPI0030ED2C46
MSTVFHGDIAITGQNTKALVSFSSAKSTDSNVTSVLLHTEESTGKIAAWGKNNDFPQKLLKKIRLNGAALSGLRVSRKAHYGSGFILAEEKYEDGKRSIVPKSINEFSYIKTFWVKNQMKRFWKETITDLEYFAIAFPEYVLSKDFKTINRIKRQKTADCRFEVMDDGTRSVQNVYLSAKWAEGVDAVSKFVSKVPLIDSYWGAEEVKEYCKKNKIYNFIRPIFYPLVDENYYPKAEWHSAINSGWLDVANSIPKFKKAFIENQLNVKFLIEVSEEYFDRKYKEDWVSFTAEKRQEIRVQFVEELDEALRDTANAGKSIMSVVYKDDNGNPLPGLKVTAVDNKLKDGAYLQDTSAGNQEILTAIGVDPSLIGAGIPGGKLGAGSGSDKREAWFILSALMKTNRETTLEPFEFIQQYNGWPPDLIGGFEDTVLTTLDKNPTGTQKAAQL